MKIVSSTLIALCLSLICIGQNERDSLIQKNVPSIEYLSGHWVSVDTVDMEPSIRNFRAQALVNRDMTSISWFASTPYSGGYHTGTMRVNESTPVMTHFRWQPYQALRRSSAKDYEINSATRMMVDQNVVMWEVDIKNTSARKKGYQIEIDHIGIISAYPNEEWQWWYPYPTLEGKTTTRDDVVENMRDHIGTGITSVEKEVETLENGRPVKSLKKASWPSDAELMAFDQFETKKIGDVLFVIDKNSDAVVGFVVKEKLSNRQLFKAGGTSYLKVNLNPNQTNSIHYAMAWGKSIEEVQNNLKPVIQSFQSEWDKVQEVWNERWYSLFDKDNDLISGTFPIFKSEDEAAKKVYYTGPLTMLYLMNTNLPKHEKVFLTGGPRWGATITFFWDITEWAGIWAVVDPEMMKDHLRSWIKIDPSVSFGQDNFMGGGVGNGYSANYWALFQMIRSYLTTTGDYDFLDEVIGEQSVLKHLHDYALHWQEISLYDEGKEMDEIYKLADFGDDEWNLLECVPTYKHIVPSFNAGYIWMMRETAQLYRMMKKEETALELENLSDEMTQNLLKLYAGDGVWYSLYPDGSKIEVRHCLDFMFLGRYIPDYIPDTIKSEMMDFVYRELITDHWMRAQSIEDVAAKDSDRPDHGPLGAFDGWPAGTMDALVQLGFPQRSLDFYHAITRVTNEGIWAQAHELWGENKWKPNAKVRIAKRGWHNRDSSSGIAMSQVMLKDFFGFYPSFHGDVIKENGNWNFDGTLYHVLYKGDYYTLRAKNGQVTMIKE